jgi:periplasmic copper chaperone A
VKSILLFTSAALALTASLSSAFAHTSAPGYDNLSDVNGAKHPAATSILIAANETPHAGMNHTAMMGVANPPLASGSAHLGELNLSGGYLKAMLPGQPVGGGYVTIENTGNMDDKLLSVSSPTAGKVELHEMSMTNNVMKMRKVDGGLDVKAGDKLEMQPGGYHLMFMGVKKPFSTGDSVPVTLNFEKAGSVDMVLPVVPARGK